MNPILKDLRELYREIRKGEQQMNPILKDLRELYKTQKVLDDRIVKEKGLEEEWLMSGKILALYVEVGELANELPKEFKFWSNKENNHEKALVEYVDCLHFILSIGIDIEYVDHKYYDSSFNIGGYHEKNVKEQFLALFQSITTFEKDPYESHYEMMFNFFLGLGRKLGFTWNQVVEAYYKKNEINHKRQDIDY